MAGLNVAGRQTMPVIIVSLLDEARHQLQAYADRGVFRGLSEKYARGKTLFTFTWLLDRPMHLVVDPLRRALEFKDVLPGIPAGSEESKRLRDFLRSRQSRDLPEHRRVDPAKAKITGSNRRGAMSITLKLEGDDYDYGVNRIINLVHELFVHLRDAWPEYLMENFDVPQE
jgi:hypothetical protein